MPIVIDRITAAIMMVFGVTVLMLIPSQVSEIGSASVVGPSDFPRLLAVGLICLGALLLVLSFRGRARALESESTRIASSKKAGDLVGPVMGLGPLVLVLSLLVYVLLLRRVGYVVTNSLHMVCCVKLMGARWFTGFLVAVFTTLILVYVFKHLLGVWLP